MYYQGRGLSQDDTKAVTWFRKAAEQGFADAQRNLGAMYGMGRGVPQDYIQAHKWSNLAATQGIKEAQKNREVIAKKMVLADISKALRLAREWRATHGKGK